MYNQVGSECMLQLGLGRQLALMLASISARALLRSGLASDRHSDAETCLFSRLCVVPCSTVLMSVVTPCVPGSMAPHQNIERGKLPHRCE
jgi:hypothetical protein